jgi:mutator protein MutT
MHIIHQNKLREEVKKKIFDGFVRDAINATGINGLEEEPVSFEIFHDQEFVGACVVQLFWGQLHIKYLYVEKAYRGQGLGRKLLERACAFGRERGCRFAFVETMNFQAPAFYQKLGFHSEFSRAGFAKNTIFHYLKKNLIEMRTGVYGVAMNEGKMLLIRQKSGPYAGKFDFPGGGIEFGETPEQALHREFKEELGMEFDSLQLIDNLTAAIEGFFQVGMIYRVEDCRSNEKQGSHECFWLDPHQLLQENCSKLLWKYRMRF